MRIFFWLATGLNGVAFLYGLYLGFVRLLTAHGNRGAILVPIGISCVFLLTGLTGYWLWTTEHYRAAFWVSITLWLTVLVAGVSLLLLTLGQRWN